MDSTEKREWYRRRLEIADGIMSTYGDDGQFDAEILLCCAVSALAKIMWPDAQDKRRFVEFLVQFAPNPSAITRVSIPILCEELRAKGDNDSADFLRSHFLPDLDERIPTGEEVDQSEDTLVTLLPRTSVALLRRSSYAAIIYIDLRCGLVHEYRLSSYMFESGLSHKRDVPSYVNFIPLLVIQSEDEKSMSRLLDTDEPDVEPFGSKSEQRLFLPYSYVRRLITGTAEAACDYWDSATEWEHPKPQKWWIEG